MYIRLNYLTTIDKNSIYWRPTTLFPGVIFSQHWNNLQVKTLLIFYQFGN